MVIIIFIAAVMVLGTIALSLVTAYDLQRQRDQLAQLEKALVGLEKQVEEAELQRVTASGSLDMMVSLLSEKRAKIESLGAEFEQLKEERVGDHEVKSKIATHLKDPMEE